MLVLYSKIVFLLGSYLLLGMSLYEMILFLDKYQYKSDNQRLEKFLFLIVYPLLIIIAIVTLIVKTFKVIISFIKSIIVAIISGIRETFE